MNDNKITSDLLRGNTDTMILGLLREADRYGYEIVKLVAERSKGEYELKEATMYSSVRRLESDGDIEWYWGDESLGGRRKYFRITDKGKKKYVKNKNNWEYAKRVLDNLFSNNIELWMKD
jgi:PadR family transcriptional regulator, regulatory protein PadR